MSDFKTPRELWKAYRDGLPGATCNYKELDELLAQLPKPLFGVSAHGLAGDGAGKLSLPFKSLLKFDPGFGPAERQETGDCVSHGQRNAIDVTRAVEIDIKRETEDFVVRSATEAIYGSRGHGGQGMTCSGAAKFVNQLGGILLRKNYPDIGVDFSKYNANLGAGWGSRGVPEAVKKEGQKHQVKTISLITTIEEARDAIANGYAINVCSSQGFSSKRDKNGFAKPSGSWSHAMCWIACDDTNNIHKETCFLVQNSWGIWNSGPKTHGQPEGSFWIREGVAQKMLNARGAWVTSNVDGFPPRKLPDYGTSDYL